MKAIIYSSENNKWLSFSQPKQIYQATSLDEVPTAIAKAEDYARNHSLYMVGFVSYDAAPAFDPALPANPNAGVPYCLFGLFNTPEQLDNLPTPQEPSPTINWHPSITKERYLEDLNYIRTRLEEGDTYQVNHTFRFTSTYQDNCYTLFHKLTTSQPTQYASYIETDEIAVCSASPELFFSRKGEILTSKPMKGTAPRGLDYHSDIAAANTLANDPKSKAENVMIVDMIRNDMGRIAKTGSVQVNALFTTERYPTLWQMTSTVQCFSEDSLLNIFTALFPCASITGAPKRAAMQIIADRETTPRKLYCGSIGYMLPNGDCTFNVAIRTALIDKQNHTVEYGSGGGIVWDSCAHAEYDEACLKAKLLNQPAPAPFQLLETILFTQNDGYYLLDEHLQRMAQSAEYFDYEFPLPVIKAELNRYAQSFDSPMRIRLLLAKDNTFEIQSFNLDLSTTQTSAKISLPPKPIDKHNIFLYHKTTNRDIYTNASQSCPEADDVILHNQEGEITESTIANIVIEINGNKYTPPVTSGLLAGTFRNHLLKTGEISEKIITVDELRSADKIYLINSVRKWRQAILI